MSLAARVKAISWWRALWRPVLAFLAASYAASIVIMGFSLLDDDDGFGGMREVALLFLVSLSFMEFVVILAAIPAASAILVIRISRIPRGYAETAAGAICAMFVMRLFANPWTGDPPNMLNGEYWAETWPFILAGAVAGLVYWLANGRPRNPGVP